MKRLRSENENDLSRVTWLVRGPEPIPKTQPPQAEEEGKTPDPSLTASAEEAWVFL